MRGVRKVKRIGIFGHVGNRNLGDESIISSVVKNVRRRDPEIEIYGFTLNPQDTWERHGIASFPIRRVEDRSRELEKYESEGVAAGSEIEQSMFLDRLKALLKSLPLIHGLLKGIKTIIFALPSIVSEARFLITCYRNLCGVDLLIVAGSQQLIDFIGLWYQPYNIYKWTWVARATKTKVAFLSVGAGPITKPLGRFFIKHSLSHACYSSVRDESSRKAIEQIGIRQEIPVFPDLVYSLGIESRKPRSSCRKPAPIVAINPVPFSDPVYWPGSNDHVYEKYVNTLARFALWLIQRGYAVLFFPTQLYLDPPVITDIRKAMKKECSVLDFEEKIVDWPIQSYEDLVSAVLMADMVVAARFHGVVIPFVLQKPVLAVAYHQKTFDLMAQMGQHEYVLDIRSCDENQLQERFAMLESRSEAVTIEIEQKTSLFREALDTQYDKLLTLI